MREGLVSPAWPGAAWGLTADPVSTVWSPFPTGSKLEAWASQLGDHHPPSLLPTPSHSRAAWALPEAWSNEGRTLPLGGWGVLKSLEARPG